jgi:transcriptional regulator with XRE-family HTH domain
MSEPDAPRIGPGLNARVAEEVRALMGRRKVSGAELARAIKVPQASLQRRLSGRYPFYVDTLAAIADYLGTPLGDLLDAARYGGDAAMRQLGPAPQPGSPVTGAEKSRPEGVRDYRSFSSPIRVAA